MIQIVSQSGYQTSEKVEFLNRNFEVRCPITMEEQLEDRKSMRKMMIWNNIVVAAEIIDKISQNVRVNVKLTEKSFMLEHLISEYAEILI